ncbi:MAG TPA: transcriptional repressor LexA [Symbiobacteriaceae bacterium]|jgi:repressor LexA|nr:transcriptional repressor LexA [Symbiobacteriaceae bacterium]
MNRPVLSERQQRMLDVLRQYIREHGYPPSVRELGELVGLSSTSTVHGHLEALERKGYIRRDPTKSRTIDILDGTARLGPAEVPVLGSVAAGLPILAVQQAEEFLPVAPAFGPAEGLFFLRVKGESMIEAGILDGDLVLCRRQQNATNGDIVVAMVTDGGEAEATLKRFYRERGYIRLQPENSRMAPILVPDCTILGKMVGLVRRM